MLRGLNDQGIVASICPKVSEPAAGTAADSDPNYGYNPAVAAIIDRLRGKLKGRCLPRAIQTDPATHQVLCTMIEAKESSCDCSAEGRGPANPDLAPAVQRELAASGHCGGPDAARMRQLLPMRDQTGGGAQPGVVPTEPQRARRLLLRR